MKPSNEMIEELNLAERRIIKVQTVIDFEKEPRIRLKALQIEEKLRDIFPQPALVTPVSDDEAEEIPRVIFEGAERCVFSQIRIDYVVRVEKNKSKEVQKVFSETEEKAIRIFNAFHEETGRSITRMGIIAHFVFPLKNLEVFETLSSHGKGPVGYLHRVFFKQDFTPANLTELDFHFAQQSQDKYNINWFIKAVRVSVSDEPEKEALLTLVDVNNYLEKNKKQITTYKESVIKELFGFVNDLTGNKLHSVVQNKFTLE